MVEIDANEQISALITFDPDDFDAAFEELNTRYLAGDAAAHRNTWSVIARSFDAVNRHEVPDFTPDFVNIDHRQAIAFEPGEMTAYIHATLNDARDVRIYIEAVHRLSSLGVVVTHVAHNTSQQGFEAEWRLINLSTIEGDLINRCELFDEADLDAALARFDELSPSAPQLENAASRLAEGLLAHFAARNWDALAQTLAADYASDDRRLVVGAGVRHGRAAAIENYRAMADIGFTNISSTVIATRGQRLAVTRAHATGGDPQPEAFRMELLVVVEIDTDHRIVAVVVFDVNDIDAAFEELDARYLAGEAAAHVHTWSVVADAVAAANRYEFPALTPDWVNADHRRAIAFAPGDMTAYVEAIWATTPHTTVYVEAVHRLSAAGAVVTQAARGASEQGFEAEWRLIGLSTVDGDLINRCELFDETDLEAALVKFDQLTQPVLRLENAASQVYERFWTCYGARDWAGMAEMLAAEIFNDDRRRVVNAGVQHGRDAQLANMRNLAEIGANITSTIMATRGQRLVLSRFRSANRDLRHGEFDAEMLSINEIDTDNRISAGILFDVDDIDAAFEELDSRYLAGEAAAQHPHTWSVIAGTYAAFNRHGLVPDWVSVDHRRGSPFVSGDLNATIRAARDLTPDLTIHVETVHRLGDLGAVVTNMSFGTSPAGFAAEWRMVQLLTVKGDRIDRLEIFDEADIDAALAKFDELNRPAPRLENAASQLDEGFRADFAARDWDAMAELLADDTSTDDRRPLFGVGVRRNRDAVMADWQATAEVGVNNVTSTVIAIRGDRLVLSRYRFSGRDQRPEAFRTDVLGVVEIDTDQRITACVMLDTDDIDAAFAELNARYLAGEAAPYSHTWSVVTSAYAALNRHELPATTPDWVNIDRQRLALIETGDMYAHVRAAWEVLPDWRIRVVAVHRLTEFGAVATWAAEGTSQEGFETENHGIAVLTLDGDLIKGFELFDEEDVEAAVARFDELNRQAPQLENAASRVYERLWTYFDDRDWDAMTKMFAAGISTDDRRRVVNAGVQHGRDVEIASLRSLAEIEANITCTVMAIRGERLLLTRVTSSNRDLRHGEFAAVMLVVIEIDADNRIAAGILFDTDDIVSAVEELDARYLAGEAASHANTWSLTMQTFAGFNRRELAPTTPDWINIDHRRGIPFAPGDMISYIRTAWDVAPDVKYTIRSVHRLNHSGAVVTSAGHGTSHQGFDAEWCEVYLLTFEDNQINRCEVFDVDDVDAALARFEDLHPSAPRLENAASRVGARFSAYMAAPDWAAMAEMVAEDMCNDDRRPVINAGLRRGRDAEIANVRTIVNLGVKNTTPVVIATRGERLALARIRISGRDVRPEAFHTEVFGIIEIDTENRIAARIWFELDDIDAAFEELDTRYLAGEAAAHAHTWSLIAQGHAAFNRRELPATPPYLLDHRPLVTVDEGDPTANVRAMWDFTPDLNIYIESVHRLSDLGAVFTQVSHGASQAGFDAEWRIVELVTVDADLINRCELFDETDIDAALAKFNELCRPAPLLENGATRAWAAMAEAFNRRDLDGGLGLVTADGRCEDRRKGLRVEGAARDVVRPVFDAPKSWQMEVEPVAIRGSSLGLTRQRYRDTYDIERPVTVEFLTVTTVSDDDMMHNAVVFDPDEIDAAMGELTARWIASGEVAHPEVIEAARQGNELYNRHDWDAVATREAGAIYVNHRQLASVDVETIADHWSSIRTLASLIPDMWVELPEILTYSATGLVNSVVVKGTTAEGAAIELPAVTLVLFDGLRVTRMEAFDSTQRDLALARFDELNQAT